MLTFVFADGEVPGPGRKVNEWFDDDGEVIARAFIGADIRWIDWPGVGVFAVPAASHEVRVWPEIAVRHEVVVDTFFRVQPIILQALGWEALHASATLGPTGVLGFCGRGGSGKSTLAFAMQQAGWLQFADDALLLRLDGEEVAACPLSFTPRLRLASRVHFADASVLPSQPQPKDAPLNSVFILRQQADFDSPRISLLPRARAFSEVLPHAQCFDPVDPTHSRRLVQSYLALAARVPVFTLEYRPNLQHLPRLIHAILEAAAGFHGGSVGAPELRAGMLLA
jgi:hypothetical protein